MEPVSLTAREALRLRMRAQRLSHPADSLAGLFRGVFAFQAQDLPAAVLSIRARTRGLNAAQIEQALREPRKIAWLWSLRGTLHLTAAEDARWLVPLLGPDLIVGDERRMRQLEWDEHSAEAAMRLVRAALEGRERMVRGEVARLMEANGFPHEGQAPVHLIFRAALEGVLCPVPDQGKATVYAPFERWIGAQEPRPREEALRELALRYLRAYAPATVSDLAAWSGLKMPDARLAWKRIEERLIPVEIEGKPAALLEEQAPWLEERSPAGPVVRLLPRFDTYLLGYTRRDLYLNPADAHRIANGGIINATLVVDGRVVGTWKTAKRKNALEVVVTPFEPLREEVERLVEAEARDIERFLGQEAVLKIDRPS